MKMIKNHAGSLALACLLFAAALAACGGGGDDDAGSQTTFSVQPDTVTFTSTTTVCAGGGNQDVYVYGGTAPYRIDNTVPDYVTVDKNQVDSRGGHFTVTTRVPVSRTGRSWSSTNLTSKLSSR